MADRIMLRRDTAANWVANNPILALGEIGIEIDTNSIKIGNGVTVWGSLGYFGGAGGETGTAKIFEWQTATSYQINNILFSSDAQKLYRAITNYISDDTIEADIIANNLEEVFIKENYLENPLTDGEFLKSTIDGTRYWDIVRLSVGMVTQPTFQDNSDGTADIGSATCHLRTASDHTGVIAEYTIPGKTLSFTDGAEEGVAVRLVDGVAEYYIENNPIANINYSNNCCVYRVWRVGNYLHRFFGGADGLGLSNKLNAYVRDTEAYRLSINDGFVISEETSPSNRTIAVTAGLVYKSFSGVNVTSFNSYVDVLRETVSTSGGWAFNDYYVYDNTSYNPDGGGKVSIPTGKWAHVQYFRTVSDIEKIVFYILSPTYYNNSTEAEAAAQIIRDNIPLVVKNHCIFIGYSIIQANATNGVTESVLNSNGSTNLLNHNDLLLINGGDVENNLYYHSDQSINIADDVVFHDIEATGALNVTGVATATGGLADANTSAPIAISTSTDTEFNTVKKSIVGSVNEVIEKQNVLNTSLSSGVLWGMELSINVVDNSLYDIAPGAVIFVDTYTDPETPSITVLDYPDGITGITPDYGTGGRHPVYIAMDKTGTIEYSTAPLTNEEYADLAYIGVISVVPSTTTVVAVYQFQEVTANISLRLLQFLMSVGSYNISGNIFSNSVLASPTLKMSKTAGYTFRSGSNWGNNKKVPDIYYSAASDPVSYLVVSHQSGSWYYAPAPVTDLDPEYYDNLTDLTAVPTGHWQIKTIFFSSSAIFIQYGQETYASLDLAKGDLYKAIQVHPILQSDFVIKTYIIIQQGCTNVADPNTCVFINNDNISFAGKGIGSETNNAVLSSKVSTANFSLEKLNDVALDSPALGERLAFNGVKWVNTPAVSAGAGAGISFYMSSVESDLFSTTGYYYFEKYPEIATETQDEFVCNNNKVEVVSFVDDPDLLLSILDQGTWTLSVWASADDNNCQIVVDFYRRTSGGTETLLFSISTGDLTGTLAEYKVSSVQEQYTLNTGDRLVIKQSIQTTNEFDTTVTIVRGGDDRYSYISTPLSVNHNNLNGLQGGASDEYYHITQAEAVVVGNTSGTNTGDETTLTIKTKLGITTLSGSNTGDETLSSIKTKLGAASSGTDGYLTYSDWNTFNGKLSGNILTTLGDIIVRDDTTAVRLAGNTTTTKNFLSQTGTGSASAVPTWSTIANGDIPSALTGKTYNGLTITSTSGSLTITDAKILTVNNTLTLSGIDSSTLNIGNGTVLSSIGSLTAIGAANRVLGINNAGTAHEYKAFSVSAGPLSFDLATANQINISHIGSSITPSSGTIGTSGTLIKTVTTDSFAHVATITNIPYDAANTASTLMERDSDYRSVIGALQLGTSTPASPANRDIYGYSSWQAPMFYGNSLSQWITRNIWVQTAENTIPSNITAATSLLTGNGGAGLGSLTFPAGFWTAGRTVRIQINGHIVRTGNAGVGPQVSLGGITLNSITGASTSNLGQSGTFDLSCIIVAYSSTTFWINGLLSITTTSNAVLNTRISMIDSTGTPTIVTVATPTTLDILATKTAAGNLTIITTSALIEVMA
jgi:hypothetical protein